MVDAAKPRLLRRINRSLVIDELRARPQLSRAELVKRTGLAKPTVSAIVDGLVVDGTVREVGLGHASEVGGRRPMLLELAPDAAAFVGVHFGVHTTRAVVADATGRVRASRNAASPRRSPTRSVGLAQRLTRDALDEAAIPASRVRSAGVAVPGPVDSATGHCSIAPNLGWRDVPIQTLMVEALGVPTVVSNIAHAAALAEARLGAAQRVDGFVWLYVGSGVGAGLVVDGRLFPGTGGMAGEIGHCPMVRGGDRCSCGRRGCLETLGSGAAIARLAGAPDAARAAAAAAGGDRDSRRAFATAGRWLGRGAATLVNVVDPALVVVGGGVAKAGELLVDPIRRSLAEAALREVPVVASALGDDAEVTGALLLATEHTGRGDRGIDHAGQLRAQLRAQLPAHA